MATGIEADLLVGIGEHQPDRFGGPAADPAEGLHRSTHGENAST